MVDRDEVRSAYDELAETYATHRSTNGRGMALLEEFLETLPSSPRVLDAGCGSGRPALARIEAAGTAVGLDFSRQQLALAAENVPGAALTQADMSAVPFDDGSFDGVVAYWSLIHVPMADHASVVEEFARVLRPGGRVLVCEGTDEWAGENPDWLDSGVGMTWNIAGREATRAQLVDAGFEITDVRGVPETLEDDDADAEDEELPWTFFAARLDG